MNLLTKKTFILVLFLFSLFFLFSPKSTFAEISCQCNIPKYNQEECQTKGFKWYCGCMGVSGNVLPFNHTFCVSSAKEIRTCQNDGNWSSKYCPTGCESGSQTCKSSPVVASSDPINSSAGNQIDLSAPGNFSGLGTITSGSMISTAVNLIYIIASITFFFILLFGGIKWITSAGDEKKLAAAKASITHGLIGLIIVFVAWALMRLISTVFGFDFTNLVIQPFYQE